MNITSSDAKIVQYKYAIFKINRLVEFLKNHSTPHADDKDESLILCHYLPLLSGNIFAINEASFNGKLEILSQYKLFKPTPINISSIVTHIPYDINDSVVNPLIELPNHQLSYRCVKQLISLYETCIAGYEKRLALALNSDHNIQPEAIDSLLEEIMANDLDLSGAPDFKISLKYNPTDNQMVFKEATLIDIDLKMVFVLIGHYTKTLNHLKTVIEPFKLLKSQPPQRQAKYLGTIRNNSVALHKLMLLTLRLNDLYIIIRKFGRKIYLSNYNHLIDQKFLTSSPNSSYFKLNSITSIDDIFNKTKKNGVLIATLTRFIRANANFEPNIKNVLDFSNFVNQGIMVLDNIISKLTEFGNLWIVNELRFRKSYNLPSELLIKIYDEYVIKPKNINNGNTESFPQIDENYLDRNLKKLDINEKTIFNRTSRSSSVSSNSSNSGIPPTRTLKPNPRPNSMVFLNPPSIQPPAGTSNDTLGRKRSNSDGLSRTSSINSNSSISRVNGRNGSPSSSNSGGGAAAGAAAALKSNMQRSPSLNRTRVLSPTPKPKQPIIVEEEPPKIKEKISANQRLQMHLRQAAKSGTLVTQEKEILTSVVFDPNVPSSVNIRKYNEVPVQNPEPAKSDSKDSLVENSGLTAPLKRKTRDQVTKLNTKRNEILSYDTDSSIVSTVSDQGDESNSDLGSKPKVRSRSVSAASTSEIPIKKVRFIGVPEYTAAEDAPTNYSSKILKNFAVFKTPSVSGFKRKDQLLKKEESLLFKSQVQQNPNTNILSNFQTAKMKIKTRLT